MTGTVVVSVHQIKKERFFEISNHQNQIYDFKKTDLFILVLNFIESLL